jgi:transposase InsO family protein
MLRLAAVVIRWLASVGRSRRELLLENIALRQQLATMVQRNRPRVRFADRVFWIVLRRVWARWAEVLVIVKPETVVGWHRAGFRRYWQRLSRRGMRRGRPVVPGEVRDLIRRMAAENQWRAPRIHGELLRLGFNVSERTVSRYLRGLPSRPERRQHWRTFMKNHREVIAAMDFFTVPTASFRLLYVLFVIRHGRRDIAHWNITEHPSARWVIQQLREAFPYDSSSRYLVFDRDAIFSAEVARAVRSLNIEPTRTSYRSPWQNGVAERFVGTVRRELLDHLIVLDDRHLHRLFGEYIGYYLKDRTHLGLDKDAPWARPVEPRPARCAAVHAQPRVGGLHHRYRWRAAA